MNARERIATAASLPFLCAYLGVVCAHWQRLDRCQPVMPVGGDYISGPLRAPQPRQARQIRLQRRK